MFAAFRTGRVPAAAGLGLLGLLGLLLLGGALRLWGLDRPLLWHDEVYTRIFAAGYQARDWQQLLFSGEPVEVSTLQHFQRQNPARSVLDTIGGLAHDEPQHPPLYYVMARAWVGLFGDSVVTLRAMSALLSLLAFPLLGWLLMELFGSRRVAWIGMALLCVSPFFVLYAREAREYALWGVWILFSMAAFLRARRLGERVADKEIEGSGQSPDQPQPQPRARQGALWRAWGLYALVVAAGLYTSFSMAAPILAQVLTVAIEARARLTRRSLVPAAALLISALLFLPWAIILGAHFEAFRASMAWSRDIVIPRSELLSTFALNLSRPFLDFWPGFAQAGRRAGAVEGSSWLVVLGVTACMLLLVAALLNLGFAKREQVSTRAKLLLLLTLALPCALLLGPDLLFGGIRSISTRYLTPTLLGLLIAVAFLLGKPQADPASSTRWHRFGQPALFVGLLGLGLASSLGNNGRVSVWTKGVSVHLPEVAALIRAASPRDTETRGLSPAAATGAMLVQSPLDAGDHPAQTLIVGNREQHNPGNLLALATLLPQGTLVQVRDLNQPYRLPPRTGPVFLFSPTPPFREMLEAQVGSKARLLYQDIYLQLWRLPTRLHPRRAVPPARALVPIGH